MMEAPHTKLPWASSDSRSELVFRDSLGMIDLAQPVAMFQHAQDARFVLDALDLLNTLADQISDIKKAFGAPGDYGYGTPSGDALFALYQSEMTIRNAMANIAEVRS